MNLLLSNEADDYILLILNTVPMSKFNSFITSIDKKANWSEELCCCYYEQINENESYRFETFEGDTFRLSYQDFLKYVKLAIIRFYLGCEEDNMKKSILSSIENTIFKSVLDNIDTSLKLDIPLIG